METQAAAFFRVEGGLVPRSAAQAAAFLAGNSQKIGQRLPRLGAVALSRPLGWGLADPTLAARVAWMGLRGMTEDRLVVLGEEYYDGWMRPSLRPVGRELVERARRAGRRVVLVSDNLDVVVRHLGAELGAEQVLCNRLELREGVATGRLADPVIGRVPGLREFAGEHGIDLGQSSGYGSVEDDSTLLAAVGLPCALFPDRALRRIARELDWPLVEAG